MSDFSEAISKIKSLEAEVERLVGASEYILEHIRPLKASRDELLESLQVAVRHIGHEFIVSKNLDKIIKKAQDIQEKETK